MEDKDRTDQTPQSTVKREQTNLDMMALDTINLEEVGMDIVFEHICKYVGGLCLGSLH